MGLITDIEEYQAHLVVNDKLANKVHVIPHALLRDIANGRHIPDNDHDELTRAICIALLDNIE